MHVDETDTIKRGTHGPGGVCPVLAQIDKDFFKKKKKKLIFFIKKIVAATGSLRRRPQPSVGTRVLHLPAGHTVGAFWISLSCL